MAVNLDMIQCFSTASNIGLCDQLYFWFSELTSTMSSADIKTDYTPTNMKTTKDGNVLFTKDGNVLFTPISIQFCLFVL